MNHGYSRWRTFFFIFLFFLIIIIFRSTFYISKYQGGLVLPLTKPLIIAHRGASKIAPENTLPAFKKALQYKPDMVELDYRVTKDGKMVVIHDEYLDRTTDAIKKWKFQTNIPVNEKTLKEIKTLDAGSWYHWGTSEFNGVTIPTLKEAMEIIQNSGFTLIERKEGEAKVLVRFLKSNGWLNKVVVQSFDWNFIKEIRHQNNDLVLAALGPPWGKYKGRVLNEKEKWLNINFIQDVVSCGAEFIVWNNWITEATVALAHKNELRVLVYTIDDPDEAERLIALGVDGIITNDPETTKKRLQK